MKSTESVTEKTTYELLLSNEAVEILDHFRSKLGDVMQQMAIQNATQRGSKDPDMPEATLVEQSDVKAVGRMVRDWLNRLIQENQLLPSNTDGEWKCFDIN